MIHCRSFSPPASRGREPGINDPRLYSVEELLRDGASIHIRAIRPDDRERVASAEAINELAAKYSDRLMVLAGDLNAEPGSHPMIEFEKHWKIAGGNAKPQAAGPLTYPSGKPSKWIDNVLMRPAARWEVVEVRVLDEPIASDHRPLLAVLKRKL